MLPDPLFICFAPNDGSDPFTNSLGQQAYSRSKQNSDAAGMKYQWGRKDSFTFAVTSLRWGTIYDYGKYPVKIYNGKSELIYQEDGGKNNVGNTPAGGLIFYNSVASSMMETIKKPNLFYYLGNYAIISQIGHSKELWDYYWTSYSRGTDGDSYANKPHWHNTYLDGYIVLRSKSIYDPCPYGYRTVANGTYNDFNANMGWAQYSYDGGTIWNNNNWFSATGSINGLNYTNAGAYIFIWSAQNYNQFNGYFLLISHQIVLAVNENRILTRGFSIRCIEDATVARTAR